MREDEKQQRNFARAYRHLQINCLECSLFLLLFVLPALILLLFYYDELTLAVNQAAVWVLSRSGEDGIAICSGTFIPWLWPVCYMDLPTAFPSFLLTLSNPGAVLVLIRALTAARSIARPIGIYLMVQLIEPLPAEDFHNFLSRSYLILTDSGGVQEEAPSLGKPILVMRNSYGDGMASRRIVSILEGALADGPACAYRLMGRGSGGGFSLSAAERLAAGARI